VFDVIERLVINGDPYVSNLAVIGYLEGFQMVTVTGQGLDPECDLRPWLGPESEKWWVRINRFWKGERQESSSPMTCSTNSPNRPKPASTSPSCDDVPDAP
jgi:hypothetical protein